MPSTPQNSAPSAFNYDTPIQDIRFVNKAQAEAFLVYPNTTVLLIDKELGVAHLKSADSTGLSKTKLYKIEEINPDGTAVKPSQPAQSINMEEISKKFVTVEQYDALVSKIKALQEIIAGAKCAKQTTERKLKKQSQK